MPKPVKKVVPPSKVKSSPMTVEQAEEIKREEAFKKCLDLQNQLHDLIHKYADSFGELSESQKPKTGAVIVGIFSPDNNIQITGVIGHKIPSKGLMQDLLDRVKEEDQNPFSRMLGL